MARTVSSDSWPLMNSDTGSDLLFNLVDQERQDP